MEKKGLTAVSELLTRLVDDGAVLEGAEIEHTNAPVGAAGYEDVDTICAEADVIDFLVVRYQLRFGGQRGNVPYRASCVD